MYSDEGGGLSTGRAADPRGTATDYPSRGWSEIEPGAGRWGTRQSGLPRSFFLQVVPHEAAYFSIVATVEKQLVWQLCWTAKSRDMF